MMNLFRILMRCHYNHFFSCFLFDSLSLSSHYIFSLRALDFDNCWLSMTVVVGGGWSALTLAFPSCLLAIAFHFVNHVSTPKYWLYLECACLCWLHEFTWVDIASTINKNSQAPIWQCTNNALPAVVNLLIFCTSCQHALPPNKTLISWHFIKPALSMKRFFSSWTRTEIFKLQQNQQILWYLCEYQFYIHWRFPAAEELQLGCVGFRGRFLTSTSWGAIIWKRNSLPSKVASYTFNTFRFQFHCQEKFDTSSMRSYWEPR